MSIQNMLKRLGVSSIITSDPKEIANAQKMILPGVGHFAKGMENIHSRGLKPVLDELALEQKIPVLGICLGMQLLCEHSEEGDADGLGWIKGNTVKFDMTKLASHHKVPHMGWNEVIQKKPSNLFEGYAEVPRYYFVHSYHMVCDKEEDVLATTMHGYEVVCAVENGNIMGTQFHPEKSHRFGMKLLTNFSSKLQEKEVNSI